MESQFVDGSENKTPYCCARPDCPWEAPEVRQAEELVAAWLDDYGHHDLLLADKWPLIGRIVCALQTAKQK